MTDEGRHSVHGGALPVSERWTRAKAHAQVFGSTRPTLLGRFSLTERIGGGGMGTVYAAWDPKLERKVALKVLHAEFERGSERLEREARALASLTHPNVITIYEVGEDTGEVYIAMELVQGPSLRAWQSSEARSCAVILQVYRQAARGLVAAHERGLVHGDFKPENVLIDDGGRVRVADFGLAAHSGAAQTDPPRNGDPSAADVTAPHLGTLVGGTPGYMAPELLEGAAPSPASDQYALCVSMLEALEGHHRDQHASGRAAVRTPAYVRSALIRGLQASPVARFPSVEALLSALAPRRRNWRWFSVFGLGAAAVAFILGSRPRPSCDGVAPEPWAESRASAARAFEQATVWVAPTWDYVDRTMTQHEAMLVQAHEDACRISGRRSPAIAHNATACLDTVWSEHTALAKSLGHGDPAALREAVLQAPVLLSPGACADDNALARFVDVEDRPLRDRLAAALRGYARLPGTAAAIDDQDLEAGLQADPLTESIARALRARQALDAGDLDTATDDLQHSATASARAANPRAQVAALTLLAFAVAQDRDRLPESEQIATQALDTLDAAGPAPLLRARLLHDLASAAAHARPPKHTEALRLHRESIALLEPALGQAHPITVRARLSLGTALARARQPKQALLVLRKVNLDVASLWSADEPTWARSRRALGLALLNEGDFAASLGAFEQSRLAHARLFGPDHLEVARDHYNAALALRRLSRDEEALRTLAVGFSIAEPTLGSEHPELIPWLSLQGRTALALERFDDAATTLRRAIRLCESDGAAPKEFAKLRVSLAEAVLRTDPQAARVHLAAARRFLSQTDGFAGLRTRAEALEAQLRGQSPKANAAQPRSR